MGRTDTNKQWTTYRILDATIDNPDLADPLNLGATGAAEGKGFILWGDTAAAKIEWDEENDRLLTTGATIRFGTDDKLEFRHAGHYIQSDAASDLMVNASTNLVLAINGTDEVNLDTTNFRVSGTNFLVGNDGAGKIVRFYSSTADYNSYWNPFADGNKGTFYFGSGNKGVDVVFAGRLTGQGMLWDASLSTLTFTGTSKIDMTTSGTGNYEIALKANSAEALRITEEGAPLMVFTTTTSGREMVFHQKINLWNGGIDMDNAVSGTYNFTLRDSVAEALIIRRGTTDMMTFNSLMPIVNFLTLVRFHGEGNRGAQFTFDSRLEFGDTSAYIYSPAGLHMPGHIYIWSNATDGDSIILRTGAGGSVQLYNCYLNLFPTATDGDTDGDIWYDPVSNKFQGRANGVTVDFH